MDPSQQSLFKFNKKQPKNADSAADQSEILDAKLLHIKQTN